MRELRKWFPLRRGLVASLVGRGRERQLRAVDGVSFAVRRGEVLGLAGESGCGKTTTGMTVLQLYRPTSGEIRFRGEDVAAGQDRRSLRAFRRQAQIVFQNPYESLNPRFTVAESVREPIAIHFPGDREGGRRRMLTAMERAGLTPAALYLDRYPHQLSGGQLQRIALARAISVEPRFLVADEPVSMLDVSIRAGILTLLRRFSHELGMAILYISHDLSTMRHVCTHVAIMYLGRIVERGPAADVLDRPRHPYARALMAAVPVMGGRRRARVELAGALPDPTHVPRGCRFHPRCPEATATCPEREPDLRQTDPGRMVACHLYG